MATEISPDNRAMFSSSPAAYGSQSAVPTGSVSFGVPMTSTGGSVSMQAPSTPPLNVAVLTGRALVVELIVEGLAAQGIFVNRSGRNEDLALALRTAANGGVIVIDGSSPIDVNDRLNLVGRCRELGGEVLVVMVDDDQVSAGIWVEAGASGVLSNSSSLSELHECVTRLSRHEIVLGVAVREGVLARLRSHRQAVNERQAAFAQLTRREAQVLRELATGASPEEVARISFVSLNTVRSQIRSVLAKLGVNSVVAAVALAYRSGWLETESLTVR
jgi:two-component system, NarL family, nitrate/nitrite response regulator NarL